MISIKNKTTLLLLLFGGIIAGFVPVNPFGEVTKGIIFFIFAVSVILLLGITSRKTIYTIVLVGFILRASVVLLNHEFPFFEPKGAELVYHNTIKLISDSLRSASLSLYTDSIYTDSQGHQWIGTTRNRFGVHDKVFVVLQVFFYSVFGSELIIGKLVNALLGSVAIYNIYRITKLIFNKERTAIVAALIVAIWPSYVYMHGVLQRDPLIFLLATQFIYLGLAWLKEGKMTTALFLVAVVIMLGSIRTAYIPMLIFTLIVPTLINIRRRRKGKIQLLSKPAYLMLGFMFIFGFFYIGQTGKFVRLGESTPPLSPEYFQTYYEHRQHGGSTYLTGLKYNSWADIIKYSPIRTIYFLYVPLPWMVHKTEALFASIDAMLLLLLSFPALIGIKEGLKTNRSMTFFVLAFFLVGITASGLITSNAGAALRYRMPFIFIIMIFSSYVISRVKIKI